MKFERYITPAEAEKGHITITKEFHALFQQNLGPFKHESKEDPQDAHLRKFYRKSGRKYTPIELSICFRNKPRNELRLYWNKEAGGKLISGEILSVDFKDGKAVLSTRKSGLKSIDDLKDPESILPISHDQHVNELENEFSALRESPGDDCSQEERKRWKRSKKIAKSCMQDRNFTCEAGWVEPVFESRLTNKPFVEVHHIIPLALQSHFTVKLDQVANLACLSAAAHRAIHFGKPDLVKGLLAALLKTRPNFLRKFGVTEQQLFRIYKI